MQRSQMFLRVAAFLMSILLPMSIAQAGDTWEYTVGAGHHDLTLGGEAGSFLEDEGLSREYSGTVLSLGIQRHELFGPVGLGAELDYARHSDSASRTECVTSRCTSKLTGRTDLDFDVTTLWLVAEMPFDNGWSVRGKGGVSQIDYELRRKVTKVTPFGSTTQTEREDDTASVPVWGVDLKYQWENDVSARLGYSADQDSQLERVSFRLTYGF